MSSAPHFTLEEYRAAVQKMREAARLTAVNNPSPEFSFTAGIVGGMLLAAAEQIERLAKIIADDPHQTEYWRLWCNVYDGPIAWGERDAFEQIEFLSEQLKQVLAR